MEQKLIQRLKELADKYEVASFCDSDPSQFLRWYPKERISDVECASFISAMLAFGSRKQFIPKIQEILRLADSATVVPETTPAVPELATEVHETTPAVPELVEGPGISAWCKAGAPNFPHGSKKFYRFYSYDDMHCLFADLAAILNKASTLGDYFEGKAFPCLQPTSLRQAQGLLSSATPSSGDTPQRPVPLHQLISQAFPNSAIVPKGANSANKRIHMFLRWMVRQNSPVDLGIWKWADPAGLLIPLDVHVMEEAINLGLLPPNAKATARTAQELTAKLAEAFPGDPTRADFALFGLGVDK